MLKETSLSYKLSQKTFHYQRDLVNFPRCSKWNAMLFCRRSYFYYYYFFFFVYQVMVVYIYYLLRGGVRNFCLRGQVIVLIYLSRQFSVYIYAYIHTLFYYTHTHKYTLFYLISYIYTHIQQQPKKKKTQYFQLKLCLMAIFHKIKFIFTI